MLARWEAGADGAGGLPSVVESAAALLVVVEVESDGSGVDSARRFVKQLAAKRASPSSAASPVGAGPLGGKPVGVLAVGRSVCAFSAASVRGPGRFAGAVRLERRLVAAGGELLVPMGSSEVELEEVEIAVVPWADAVATALSRRHPCPPEPPEGRAAEATNEAAHGALAACSKGEAGADEGDVAPAQGEADGRGDSWYHRGAILLGATAAAAALIACRLVWHRRHA